MKTQSRMAFLSLILDIGATETQPDGGIKYHA